MSSSQSVGVAGLLLAMGFACNHPIQSSKTSVGVKLDRSEATDETAEAVLREFRAQLLPQMATDSENYGPLLEVAVKKTRQKHGALLFKQSAVELARVPMMTDFGLDQLSPDPEVTPEIADRMRSVLVSESEPGVLTYQHLSGLFLMSDPRRLIRMIRSVVVGVGGDIQTLRERQLESIVTPPIVRVNADLEHPVLAIVKRRTLFVVEFAHDPSLLSYVPKRVRWLARLPIGEPQKVVRTADEAQYSLAMALEAKESAHELGPDPFSNITSVLDELTERWLLPQHELLHEQGVGEMRRLPVKAQPDLSAWHTVEGTWTNAAASWSLPQHRWQPAVAFDWLRTGILARSLSPRENAAHGALDAQVPPRFFRANDDTASPTIYTVEGDWALIVTFQSDNVGRYVPSSIRYARRK